MNNEKQCEIKIFNILNQECFYPTFNSDWPRFSDCIVSSIDTTLNGRMANAYAEANSINCLEFAVALQELPRFYWSSMFRFLFSGLSQL